MIVTVFAGIESVARPVKASAVPIPDEDDRWVLATAMDGSADVLVTGDRDLLGVAAEAPLPILAPRAFWELLRSGKSR